MQDRMPQADPLPRHPRANGHEQEPATPPDPRLLLAAGLFVALLVVIALLL